MTLQSSFTFLKHIIFFNIYEAHRTYSFFFFSLKLCVLCAYVLKKNHVLYKIKTDLNPKNSFAPEASANALFENCSVF